MYIPRVVITSGEPAGVGPDACVSLAQRDWEADLVVAADADVLTATAESLGFPLTLERYDATRLPKPHRKGILQVMHIPTRCPVVPGRPDVRNAAYVIEMLDRACDGCTNGEFAAMVDLYTKNGMKPTVDRVFPLAEAGEAQKRMEEAGQFGKIILDLAGG